MFGAAREERAAPNIKSRHYTSFVAEQRITVQ